MPGRFERGLRSAGIGIARIERGDVLQDDGITIGLVQLLEAGLGLLQARRGRKEIFGGDVEMLLGVGCCPLHEAEEEDIAESKNPYAAE